MSELTHINEKVEANMVDVTEKSVTERFAVASGKLLVSDEVIRLITEGTAKKGDVIGTARIAGIMAAKKTSELIPLCHPLLLTKVKVDFEINPEERAVICTCEVRLSGKTGAEMEAMTGVSVALLTVYDMCKAADKTMEMTDVRLLEKDGGKSGHFTRK